MKKLLAVAGVAALGLGGWKLLTRGHAQLDDSDASLITNRLWIDHMPRNDRDTVNVFIVLEDDNIGAFQAASAWQGQYEVFKYAGRGGELRLDFPQSGNKEKVRAKARECHERGMDYCLEIAGSDHGVKRYYSNEGWEVGSLAAEQTLLDRLEKQAR